MGLSTSEILDREKLLRGERCPQCSSHRLTMSIDWWVNCKDCGGESNGAHLLNKENKQLKRELLNAINKNAITLIDKCPKCEHNEFWGNDVDFPTYRAQNGKLVFIGHKKRTNQPIECENCGWTVPRNVETTS